MIMMIPLSVNLRISESVSRMTLSFLPKVLTTTFDEEDDDDGDVDCSIFKSYLSSNATIRSLSSILSLFLQVSL